MPYGSSNISFFRSYDQRQIFIIKTLVKCQGQKVQYQQKDLITRNIHVKYQSAITRFSQDLSFKKVGQTPRSKLLVPTERL